MSEKVYWENSCFYLNVTLNFLGVAATSCQLGTVVPYILLKCL